MAKEEQTALTSAVDGGSVRRFDSEDHVSRYDSLHHMELDGDLTGQTEITLSTSGEKVWGTEAEFDENAYGAAAVALIRDVTQLIQEHRTKVPWEGISLTLTRLAFSLGIMVLNLTFQSVVLWYIWIFVVQPSVRSVQMTYADYRSSNFDSDGNFDEVAWASYAGKEQACEITMSSRAFYFGILTLWGLLMMQELRSCQRVALDIWSVRPVAKLELMLDYMDTGNYELGGSCLIIGLTKGTRAAVMLLVCIPRAILGICLLYLGCQWLSSSASFADMTLNAMALEFVKNIDEILYESILPRQIKKQIGQTKVFKIERQKTKGDLHNAEWKGYQRTLGWLFFMIVFLGAYGFAAQNVLPFDLSELAHQCEEQVQLSQTPLCSHMTWSGASETCYPYGLGRLHHTEGLGGHTHLLHHATAHHGH